MAIGGQGLEEFLREASTRSSWIPMTIMDVSAAAWTRRCCRRAMRTSGEYRVRGGVCGLVTLVPCDLAGTSLRRVLPARISEDDSDTWPYNPRPEALTLDLTGSIGQLQAEWLDPYAPAAAAAARPHDPRPTPHVSAPFAGDAVLSRLRPTGGPRGRHVRGIRRWTPQ